MHADLSSRKPWHYTTTCDQLLIPWLHNYKVLRGTSSSLTFMDWTVTLILFTSFSCLLIHWLHFWSKPESPRCQMPFTSDFPTAYFITFCSQTRYLRFSSLATPYMPGTDGDLFDRQFQLMWLEPRHSPFNHYYVVHHSLSRAVSASYFSYFLPYIWLLHIPTVALSFWKVWRPVHSYETSVVGRGAEKSVVVSHLSQLIDRSTRIYSTDLATRSYSQPCPVPLSCPWCARTFPFSPYLVLPSIV